MRYENWEAFDAAIQAMRNADQEDPYVLLIDAAQRDDVAAAQRVLDDHPNLVNEDSSSGKPPIHSTISVEMSKMLIDRGADPTIETPLPGGTPLMRNLIWGSHRGGDVPGHA
jgi:hypothetical protein